MFKSWISWPSSDHHTANNEVATPSSGKNVLLAQRFQATGALWTNYDELQGVKKSSYCFAIPLWTIK